MFTLGSMEYDPEVYQNPPYPVKGASDSQELPAMDESAM